MPLHSKFYTVKPPENVAYFFKCTKGTICIAYKKLDYFFKLIVNVAIGRSHGRSSQFIVLQWLHYRQKLWQNTCIALNIGFMLFSHLIKMFPFQDINKVLYIYISIYLYIYIYIYTYIYNVYMSVCVYILKQYWEMQHCKGIISVNKI